MSVRRNRQRRVGIRPDGVGLPAANATTQTASSDLPATASLTFLVPIIAGNTSFLQVQLVIIAANPKPASTR